MPCVTTRPHRASDDLQEGVPAGRPRSAGNALATLKDISRGRRKPVHGLFRAAVALTLFVSVSHVPAELAIRAESRIEFTARTVATAAPRWLGNTAKAFQPFAVDGLLRSAGFGVQGSRR